MTKKRKDVKVGDLIDTEDTGELVVIKPGNSPFAMMIRDQEQKRGPSEQVTPTARWVEDEYVKVRWYHIRLDWFKLWASLYWEDKQPASGILCPLLGRHWYKDWRGLALILDRWNIEWMETYMTCYHCGQHTLIRRVKNAGQEEKVHSFKDMPFRQIK